MKKLFFILIISINYISAQESKCFSQIRLEKFINNNPNSKKEREKLEVKKNKLSYKKLSNTNIPVVVHVVFNDSSENISDAQIYSQIDVLNKDFTRTNSDVLNTPTDFLPITGDIQLNFCLAQQTPDGNPTNGIVRKQTTNTTFTAYGNEIHFDSLGGSNCWDTKKYLNIWVCNIDSGILGWGQFPAGGDSMTDGVVVDFEKFGTIGTATHPYNLGRTTTHEIGHWLNLWHIWGDNNCGDDFVNDTPVQEEANYGCKIHPHISCNNSGDMFMNFMDYTNDACMNSFTIGQKDRIWSAIFNYRNELLNSNGCNPIFNPNSDAGITNILEPNNTNSNCADAIYPKVIVKNFGNTILNSVIIKYTLDGSNNYYYNWSGQLNPLATDTIKLPVISSTGTNHLLTVSTTFPNGSSDINTTNDERIKIFSSMEGKLINLKIKTDNYASENSWILKTSEDSIIDSNNNMNNNTLYKLSYCLKYGCYKFIINDSNGDGFCCDFGNGFYEISEEISSIPFKYINFFNYTDTTYFCIGNTLNVEEKEEIIIYPNPSIGKIYINNNNDRNNKINFVQVFNFLGQLVYKKEKINSKIDLTHIKNGIYHLTIKTKTKEYHKKIIIKK